MISITIRLDHSKKKSVTISMSSYPEFMADQDNQQEEKEEEDGKSYEPMGMWAFQDDEAVSRGRISNPRILLVMDSGKSY